MIKYKERSVKSWFWFCVVILAVVLASFGLIKIIQAKNQYQDNLALTLKTLDRLTKNKEFGFAIQAGNTTFFAWVVDAFADNNFIASIQIVDENNVVLATKKNPAFDAKNFKKFNSETNNLPVYISQDALSDDLSLESEPAQRIAGYIKIVSSDNLVVRSAQAEDALFSLCYFLLVVMVFLLFFFIGRKFLRSVMKMMAQTTEIANGDYSIRLNDSTTVSELNILARNTNMMCSSLGKFQQDNHDKIDILETAAHEINKPINFTRSEINAIRGLFEVERYAEIPPRLDFLSNKLTDLILRISSIMTLEALKKGKAPERRLTWIKIDAFFDRAKKDFGVDAAGKGLVLTVDTNVKGLVIHADYNSLMTVIGNAVENAIKFTEFGAVNVSYAVKNDCLLVDIQDTGPGLSTDELKILNSDSPRQLGGDANRRKGGWGIGISLMKKLTKILGGTIKIESHPGWKGTKVVFSFPVTIKSDDGISDIEQHDDAYEDVIDFDEDTYDENPDFDDIDEDEDTYDENPAHDGKYIVLLFDDEEAVLKQMQFEMELKMPGKIVVYTCMHLDDAFEFIEKIRFGMICVDYKLNDARMDGCQFMEHLSDHENKNKAAHKIILTNTPDIVKEDHPDWKKYCDRVVGKGVTAGDLLSFHLRSDIRVVEKDEKDRS